MMISSFVASIVARIEAHRNYVRTVKALEVLSDRDLSDLGLTRGSIDFVARRIAA